MSHFVSERIWSDLNTFSTKEDVEKWSRKKKWHEEKTSLRKTVPAKHKVHAMAKIVCQAYY